MGLVRALEATVAIADAMEVLGSDLRERDSDRYLDTDPPGLATLPFLPLRLLSLSKVVTILDMKSPMDSLSFLPTITSFESGFINRSFFGCSSSRSSNSFNFYLAFSIFYYSYNFVIYVLYSS